MRYKLTRFNYNDVTKKYKKSVEESHCKFVVIDDVLAIDLIRILLKSPYCVRCFIDNGISFTIYPDEIHKEVHSFKFVKKIGG